MANLFLDHNLSPRLERASDREILSAIGAMGLIVITADDDFVSLHRTTPIEHAGILLVPQTRREDVPDLASTILTLLDSKQLLSNELYIWSEASGWVQQN